MLRQIRDGVLLLSGLAMLAHETVFVPEPRFILLGIAVTMLGLPVSSKLGRVLVELTKP